MSTERDQFDAMDDQSLLRYLENVATEREVRLEIGEVVAKREGDLEIGVRGEWVAETWSEGGLPDERLTFRGEGTDRRAAMLDLARRLPSNEE